MNPLGATITLALCVIVAAGSRRWAMVAIILGTCYVTQGQELSLGMHFTSIRLILLAGLIRVIARGELKEISVNKIDRALIGYALCLSMIPILRTGTSDQFTYQIGFLYNIGLGYLVSRALLKSEKDICSVLSSLAVLLIPFALLIMAESYTGRNFFAVFGGVAEASMVRDGHVRSAGAFRSPITGGAFGATFAMLYAGMLFSRAPQKNATIGLIASLIIVICARSSGPILGLAFGLLGLVCWRVRSHTSTIRRGILAALFILHFFVMKAPVWFLIARVSDIVGGGGYHRAMLIDQFINHFDTWWLAGTDNTSGWMPYELEFGGTDLTNQFVSDGVNAGLVGLTLSVILVTRCFQGIGVALTAKNAIQPGSEKMTWAIGSTLVASVAILFSVTYFDQMHVIWCFLLACTGTLEAEGAQLVNRSIQMGRKNVKHSDQ